MKRQAKKENTRRAKLARHISAVLNHPLTPDHVAHKLGEAMCNLTDARAMDDARTIERILFYHAKGGAR
jgi:hypothetical protein